MTNEVINNSYYSKSNTSNKISIGVIDVNITDSINVKLKLDDVSVLNTIMGLDFIDFYEWKNLILKYNLAILNNKKFNSSESIFHFNNDENFDFHVDPWMEEKEIFFLEDKNNENFYKNFQKNFVGAYMSAFHSFQEEEKSIYDNVNAMTSITYIDDNTIEIKNDGVLVGIYDDKIRLIVQALKKYLEKHYHNTIEYMKQYTKVEGVNVAEAQNFDDNVDRVLEFGKKEVVGKADVMDLLRSFFPDFKVVY
jgi:hypothetical protein